MHGSISRSRRRERGVTLLITAVALVVMLAMAALAIDVVTLYLASGEAQKNADAAALKRRLLPRRTVSLEPCPRLLQPPAPSQQGILRLQ
jgi:Flp pilus assembly protein TadG